MYLQTCHREKQTQLLNKTELNSSSQHQDQEQHTYNAHTYLYETVSVRPFYHPSRNHSVNDGKIEMENHKRILFLYNIICCWGVVVAQHQNH